MSVLRELRRRNVFRVCVAYGAVGWIVVQIAAVLLPVFKAPEWVLQAFTTLVILGFPLALVFAWAFELTPEGLKRTDDVPVEKSTTRQTGRQLDFLIIGALVVAVLVLGLRQAFQSEKAPPSAPAAAALKTPTAVVPRDRTTLPALPDGRASIAVLPFTNRSTSADDAFFADGMHDELLTQLARVGSIKVIARTSVLRFRDTELPISEIARQLGVATVLEGSVQRAGGQVRINVQLIDAATDAHLWAQVFDRALSTDSVFAIQSEITREIAETLKTELSPRQTARIGTAPSGNLAAYEHYLKGRQLLAERTVDTIRRGHAELEQAVALELAPGDAQTYAWFSLLRDNQGRYEDQLRLLVRARELNPLAPLVSVNLGWVYFKLARDEEAVATFKELQTRQANLPSAWTFEAYVHEARGDPLAALRVFREAERRDPDSFDNVVICDYLADLDAYEVAKSCSARQLRPRPENAGALLFSAYPELARGRLESARKIVRAADALADPDSPNWVAINWPLRVASYYVNTGQLASAHALFRATKPD